MNKDKTHIVTAINDNNSTKVRIRHDNELPAYSPVNLDEVGLRRSLRIAATKKSKGFIQHLGFIAIPDIISDNSNNSIVLNAIASTSDILNQKEAFNHPNKLYFVDAMVTEVENLKANNV